MTKQLIHFIKIWNHNTHLVNIDEYLKKTHLELFQYCIDIFLEKFNKLNTKSIILEIDKNKQLLSENINDFEIFVEWFHYKYHFDNIKDIPLNRKYVYEGQKNTDIFQLKIKRELTIEGTNIFPKKIAQKDIDYYIVKQYMTEEYNKNHKSFSNSYINEYGYKFIFYQSNQYSNSLFRIKKWIKTISKNKELHVNPEHFEFLNKIYVYFEKYNKLENEYDRLNLWIEYYLNDSFFKFFEEYFKKDNTSKYGENLISLFKNNYLKSLISEFEVNLKKSINQTEFIKLQIIENEKTLKKPGNYWDDNRYNSSKGHLEVYTDLVNGKRENYYYSLIDSQEAGVTEAIINFIKYLENLNVKKERKKPLNSKGNEITLLPIEIFDNTRGYLKKNVSQINICYKHKAYDACFVLLRKITEILIIELYEKQEIEERIQDPDGNYFMLKKLISSFQNESKFKNLFSRNINEYLPKIKKNGDLSAHNRKYNARKPDVDLLRDDFRIVFEEFVNTIY